MNSRRLNWIGLMSCCLGEGAAVVIAPLEKFRAPNILGQLHNIAAVLLVNNVANILATRTFNEFVHILKRIRKIGKWIW